MAPQDPRRRDLFGVERKVGIVQSLMASSNDIGFAVRYDSLYLMRIHNQSHRHGLDARSLADPDGESTWKP